MLVTKIAGSRTRAVRSAFFDTEAFQRLQSFGAARKLERDVACNHLVSFSLEIMKEEHMLLELLGREL